MKVFLNTTKIFTFGQSENSQKQDGNPDNQNQIPRINLFKLSNFNSIGRSLVNYKKDDDGLNLGAKTINELQELKKLYLSNQEEIDKKKNAAQANIDKIEAWNRSAEYNKQESEAEKEIDRNNLSRFWNPFKCSAIREKHYNEFYAKVVEINNLKDRKEVDRAILDSSPLSSAQVQFLVQQIDTMIEQKKQMEIQRIRLEGVDGVQKTINAMFNREGGLNDRIAGYDYEKDQITTKFIDPLAASLRDPDVKVPAAVLLHGATGTGKTTFLRGIGEQCSGYAKVIDMSSDIGAEDFQREIRNHMKDARARYFEIGENNQPKRTRTILLINEAEKFLSMTPSEANILYGENIFDDMDIEYMDNYGQSAEYINQFKSLLDTCSEAPNNINDTGRGALTVFITSNYPHLIHPDLLSRDEKMPFIAINPARNANIEAVVKHYFKKSHEVVEKIKAMKNSDDIKSISGFTRKAEENIRKMITMGTIDKLNIDYENIPFDKFSIEFNPSMKKGAFSNDTYRKIAANSLNMYFEDPSHTYEYYFATNLINEDAAKKLPNGTVIPSSRDINPQRYKKFVSIYNMLAPATVDEKQSLLSLERMDLLDDKAQKRLDYIRVREASELRNLEEKENKGIITDIEKIKLQELRDEDIVTEIASDIDDEDI